MAVEDDEEGEAAGSRRRKKAQTERASKKQCAGTVSPAEEAAGKLGGARTAVKKKRGQRADTFSAAGKLGGAGRAVEKTKKTVVTKKGEAAGKLGGVARAVKKKKTAATPAEVRTEFLGVSRALNGKYRAQIWDSKGQSKLWLGTFGTAVEAARAYDAAAVQLHGTSAVTNFKESCELSGQAAGSVKMKVKKQVAARADSRSGIRGVCRKPGGKYAATIWDPSRRTHVYLGRFGTAEEAVRAYDAAAIKLRGCAAAPDDGEVSSMDFLDDFPELPALDFSESLIPGPQKDDLRTDSSPVERQLVHEFLKDMDYTDVVA
jgi:hypothetical protein